MVGGLYNVIEVYKLFHKLEKFGCRIIINFEIVLLISGAIFGDNWLLFNNFVLRFICTFCIIVSWYSIIPRLFMFLLNFLYLFIMNDFKKILWFNAFKCFSSFITQKSSRKLLARRYLTRWVLNCYCLIHPLLMVN